MRALAVAMASPTPHRMALCALARYLGTSRPLDAEASELRVREPPPSCVRNLSESDWRLLSLVLMREATATERGREPSMRAFHATLDRISQAHGAPPAEPFPPPPDLEAATEARVARSPGLETRARTRTQGEIQRESFLEKRLAECHALLRDAPPANLADVLVEACGSLRDVDDLERLFRDVEPRSAHAAEMRGGADDGALWPSPVDADSAVGLFLRQCVADFAAAPFERACALAQAMDAYRREGHGEYDEVNDASANRIDAVDGDANGAKTNSPETLLRADARWDAAEAAAERADAAAERRQRLFSSPHDDDDDDASFENDFETNDIATPRRDGQKISAAQFRECFSSLVFVSRDGRGGSAPYAFAPPADPRSFLERVSKPSRAAEAERVRTAMLRADAGESVFREGALECAETVEGLENALGSHFLAHLDAATRRDFESAEAHLRRHFDYVDPTAGSNSLSLPGSTHDRERERETSLHALGGFFPPENPAFFSGSVTAAGDVSGDAAGAGQKRSRWRLHAAALSLARAHVNAARADEALKALNETVRVAQQNGDTGALANAVAALCALSASSAAPVASREGVPAERAYSKGDKRGTDDDDDVAEETRNTAESEDHRVLLQRLVAQARALKDPTLLAFADIANARRRAATPAAGSLARRAPETRGVNERMSLAGSNPVKGAGSGSAGSAFATAAARARAVRVSPPATAAAAARRVEELRHHAALGAAAPVSSSFSSFGVSEDANGSGAAGETAKTTPTSFYPPPRGLSAASLADVAASASVSQLAGSASALAAAVWEAHGVASAARVCALKHVRLDASKCAAALPSTDEVSVDGSDGTRTRLEVTSVSAAAVDTATALAQLARHAAREHGPRAAFEVLEVASRRFPGFGTSGDGGGVPPDEEEKDLDGERVEKVTRYAKTKTVLPSVPAASPAAAAAAAAAKCETRLMACIARESYHDARACVSALAALAPALSCWDPETRVEAFRAGALVKLVANDLVGAHDDAVSCLAASRRLETGATHKSVAASLDLADIFLKAGAFAQALPHALAAEHVAAVSELDGARAAAAAAAAECLLGLDAGAGGAFAAAAAEALDAHAVGLLGKGGLAVRARARLAAGKAALATRERVSFASFVRGANDYETKKGETRESIAEKIAEASAGADPVMAPLASAAAAAETAGSFALEAEAHYLRAMRLNQLGDVKGRNEAARAFRRCDRAARRARRGDPGATGEETR